MTTGVAYWTDRKAFIAIAIIFQSPDFFIFVLPATDVHDIAAEEMHELSELMIRPNARNSVNSV